MPDIRTNYMGLDLKNPIIVSSCDLTKSLAGIQKCEDAGAGAVILKSIFEEQFILDAGIHDDSYSMYPEAADYLRSGGMMEYAPQKMCALIEKAKKEISIPVIASINCQSDKLWPRFAKQIQDAGADALELNIYLLPYELEKKGSEYEDHYVRILRELEADINIKTMKTRNVKGKGNFSQSLRWVALLSGRVDCDVASSGGVNNSEDMIKQILAGASAVQVCSLFFKKGLNEITNLIQGLEDWMVEKKFKVLDEFRGELSFKKQELSFSDLGEAGAFFRNQYLKLYS